MLNFINENGHINSMDQWQDNIIVIKLGGSLLEEHYDDTSFIHAVSNLLNEGFKLILVHGGGKHITSRLETMAIENKFVSGYRVTNVHAMKEVEMVLSGHVNQFLTQSFIKHGIQAVGISGKDGGLFQCSKKKLLESPKLDLGFVGEIKAVNPELIYVLLRAGYLPIVSSISYDVQGDTYNINADDVAGEIAASVKAHRLIMMTDEEGLYKNFEDKTTLIETIEVANVEEMINSQEISGGMIPKLKSCVNAINKGSQAVHIVNGKDPCNLTKLLKNERVGTKIV